MSSRDDRVAMLTVDAETIVALYEQLLRWEEAKIPAAQLLRITVEALEPIAADLRVRVEEARARAAQRKRALARLAERVGGAQ